MEAEYEHAASEARMRAARDHPEQCARAGATEAEDGRVTTRTAEVLIDTEEAMHDFLVRGARRSARAIRALRQLWGAVECDPGHAKLCLGCKRTTRRMLTRSPRRI